MFCTLSYIALTLPFKPFGTASMRLFEITFFATTALCALRSSTALPILYDELVETAILHLNHRNPNHNFGQSGFGLRRFFPWSEDTLHAVFSERNLGCDFDRAFGLISSNMEQKHKSAQEIERIGQNLRKYLDDTKPGNLEYRQKFEELYGPTHLK